MAVHRRHAGEKEAGDYQIGYSQIFPELTGKIFVILRDNPRARLRLTACFLSPPLFRNSIARGGSLFRRSRVSGK